MRTSRGICAEGMAHPGLRPGSAFHGYLDELRTTQRYPIYRALKHPLYPILRKIERIHERVDIAQGATGNGRVIYISNHKSHLDYLVEPLVLDDNGIRPPVIAAGINLFGGPLGLIHRHVTGAIPIRRNTKDPAYLVTLKAYIAEILGRHDLLFYIEGGRSYSGELKTPGTGLLHAALTADRNASVIVPMAICLRSQHRGSHPRAPGNKTGAPGRSGGKLPRWCATPSDISTRLRHLRRANGLKGYDPDSRRDVMALAHLTRDTIGRLYKVLPTAVVSAALRPGMDPARARAACAGGDRRRGGRRREPGSHVGPRGRRAGRRAAREARGIVHVERGGRFRVRERTVLRYYARTLSHLLASERRTPRMH